MQVFRYQQLFQSNFDFPVAFLPFDASIWIFHLVSKHFIEVFPAVTESPKASLPDL